MKENFIKKYHEHIQREGADRLLNWLEKSDFYQAPASTRFHGSYPGGLVEHSVHVFDQLNRIVEVENLGTPMESVAICSLLHDICKVNFYKESTRNVKNEQTGQWEKKPFYMVEDTFPYGHGEKSVFMISQFMRLNKEEAMAIRWHMGGFDEAVKGGSQAMTGAYEQFPLAVALHMADIAATYLDGTREEKVK